MNLCFLSVFVFISILLTGPPTHAQKSPVTADKDALIELGTGYTIDSEVLGREWPYEVYLPPKYHDSTYAARPYPVLVVLSRNFQLAVSLTHTMSQNDQIPPMLVVGIPMGGPRTYHGYLTPTRNLKLFNGRELPGVFGMSGQARTFHTFLKKELLPPIDAEYRTMPYRVLAGESIGGLFTLHKFLDYSDTFQGYLAIEPSLWWDEQVLVNRLSSMNEHQARNRLKGQVFIALAPREVEGESREMMDGPIRKFANSLEELKHPELSPNCGSFPMNIILLLHP